MWISYLSDAVSGDQWHLYFLDAARVLQELALGSLLINLYHSKHGMFADDLTLYKEISTLANCELLQSDLFYSVSMMATQIELV